MRRPVMLGLALAAIVAACAPMFTTSAAGTDFSVGVAPDRIMEVAKAQLEQHNYKVITGSASELVTVPMPVPEHLRQAGQDIAGQLWMVRVTAESPLITRGSHVRVAGFLIPADTGSLPGSTTMSKAIPITAAHVRLQEEVRRVAKWIGDAVDR